MEKDEKINIGLEGLGLMTLAILAKIDALTQVSAKYLSELAGKELEEVRKEIDSATEKSQEAYLEYFAKKNTTTSDSPD